MLRHRLAIHGNVRFTTRHRDTTATGTAVTGTNLETQTALNAIAAWIAAGSSNVVTPAGPTFIALGTGPTNLLTAEQADFETGTVGWAAVSNCSIAQSPTEAWSNLYSLKMTASSAGTMTAGTLTGTSAVPVTQGDGVEAYNYCASAHFFAGSSARSCTVAIAWYNSAGTYLSTSTGSAVTDSASVWVRGYVFAAAPSTAAYAAVQVSVASAGSAEAHYVDAVQLAYAPDGPYAWAAGQLSGQPQTSDSQLTQERAGTRAGIDQATSQSSEAMLVHTYQLTDPAGTFQEAGLFDSSVEQVLTASLTAAGSQSVALAAAAPAVQIGQPVYIATDPLAPPAGPSFGSASTTGGHLTGGTTYYYVITATNSLGESTVGTETNYPVPSGTNTNRITLTFNGVPGATGYNIYRGTSGGTELKLAAVSPAATATTLTGLITDTSTTINVASASGFPGSGSYNIIVGGEEMTVTAGAGTTTWTVTRGVLGTPAAAAAGAAVTIATQTYADTSNTTPSGPQPTTDTSGGGGEYAVVAATYPAGAGTWTLTDMLLRGHPAGAQITVFSGGLWAHVANGYGLASAPVKTSQQLMTVEWTLQVTN